MLIYELPFNSYSFNIFDLIIENSPFGTYLQEFLSHFYLSPTSLLIAIEPQWLEATMGTLPSHTVPGVVFVIRTFDSRLFVQPIVFKPTFRHAMLVAQTKQTLMEFRLDICNYICNITLT